MAVLKWRMKRGLSLNDALIVPGFGQRWVSQVEAAYLIGLMWNCLDANVLAPHISDDVVYESQHVIEPLQGKSAVMEYLRDTMRAIHRQEGGDKIVAEIGVSRQGPCAIIRQGHPEAPFAAIMAVEVREGAIIRISVCRKVPASLTVRATGIVPP